MSAKLVMTMVLPWLSVLFQDGLHYIGIVNIRGNMFQSWGAEIKPAILTKTVPLQTKLNNSIVVY